MAANFYLPDDCWRTVFTFLIKNDEDDKENSQTFKSLSRVSKQFLSITNSLRFTLTIYDETPFFLPRLFQRFTNLTCLDTSCYSSDMDLLLNQISHFPLNLKSLILEFQLTFPTKGLRAFSQNITTLTSLTCSRFESLDKCDLCLIADCFPNLQSLDLNHCDDVCEEGIVYVLMKCLNIRHLNLAYCLGLKLNLNGLMKFDVPQLEVLNLSHTRVDDEALSVISKSCHGLMRLLLLNCDSVTKKGVKHVVENCTQLREIYLDDCVKVHPNLVASLVLPRSSLRKNLEPITDFMPSFNNILV
ncbi:putative leucine-rich repeat domain, L domain-containing protein [Medicago truncatula]|uniref:Putative leucine-rich repeat domain, L domain-containing protein n=1 Tax=Medicago truncatula TaxID=3880 RepID=G7KLQ3_MEDTR|nr:RNI superfamily protein, putative [Medicago truncatula]RHN52522.1 putative leucine-rich repeat domain, L domain-containing protein [Medicago truncatula]